MAMAGIHELSRKMIFFIFLLVLNGNRTNLDIYSQPDNVVADSVKLSIGMDLSTVVKVNTKPDMATAIKTKSTTYGQLDSTLQ